MSEANDKNDALDDYLSGDSTLSRRYRSGGSPQPSAAVDRAILDAASEGVANEGAANKGAASEGAIAPTPRRRRLKLSWERPLAIAAAVTLSTILVVSIQREAGLFPPEDSAAERSLDERNGAARPAAGAVGQRPAAPEQQADTSSMPRALSDAPASSEAVRPAKEPAARSMFADGLSKEATEPGSKSPAADDPAIEDALARINMAWRNGEAERAEQLLGRFRDAYPGVGEERLREALPAALLDRNE